MEVQVPIKEVEYVLLLGLLGDVGGRHPVDVLHAHVALGVRQHLHDLEEEQKEDRQENISERYQCYVPGQCQEYSVDFKKTEDVDHCQKFCGTDDSCHWWSFEPAQNLCVLFGNCTESGNPDQAVCPDCISGQKLCPARVCHGAFKCEGHFIDSFTIAHLEDCIKACQDDEMCMWYSLEKTHDHCVLYEDCDVQNDCDTCASGKRDCSMGYHGPTTPAPTQAPAQAPYSV